MKKRIIFATGNENKNERDPNDPCRSGTGNSFDERGGVFEEIEEDGMSFEEKQRSRREQFQEL